jgi:2-polyprenyl-6-hydroxyphenyl methylase/3-demethylubiquinone-9 3-methyltransferase
MKDYYGEKLSALRLKTCYDLAPTAVRRYLAAEIEHVRSRLAHGCRILELGCGYGRIMRELAPSAGLVAGIDTSAVSLRMAREYLARHGNTALARMDAVRLGFAPASFDLVYCVQNGISAFHAEPRALWRQALAVTRDGGRVLFSSYAEEFWADRLAWFRIQAEHGLVGPIDEKSTGQGRIVCRDGFTATTVSAEQFLDMTAGLGSRRSVEVVAHSSVFCEVAV